MELGILFRMMSTCCTIEHKEMVTRMFMTVVFMKWQQITISQSASDINQMVSVRLAKRVAIASLQLFAVRQGATTTGRVNKQRFSAKKIEDEVKNKKKVASTTATIAHRNKKNLRNVWRNIDWEYKNLVEVELVPGDGIGKPPSPKWIYVDDTITSDHEKVMPVIEGIHKIKYLSKMCKLIDFGDNAGILMTKEKKIIAIMSSKKSVENMGVNNFKFKYGPAMQEAIEIQADLKRNPNHEGGCKKYVGIGYHTGRYFWRIMQYVTNTKSRKKHGRIAQPLYCVFQDLARATEENTRQYLPRDEWIINERLNKECGLSDVRLVENGLFSQFVVALDYCSPAHIDDDFTRTVVSVYNPKLLEEGNDDILHYFVFPSFRIAVAMRNCSMLSFDSSFMHCATNPRHEGTFIYSLFTSSDLATKQMALTEEAREKKEIDNIG